MASFLRRFTTSASAGKNIYFILAAASAVPVYTIFNDNYTPSASLSSRSNVFVSTKNRNLCCFLGTYSLPPPPQLSLISPLIQNLAVVSFSNFSMTRFQKRHVISVNLLLASMDLGMQGVVSIESSQGYVYISCNIKLTFLKIKKQTVHGPRWRFHQAQRDWRKIYLWSKFCRFEIYFTSFSSSIHMTFHR